MKELKGNSYSQRTEQKDKLSPVTTNVKEKTTEIGKLKTRFFAEDSKSVAGYILNNVIIPGAKDLITKIVKNGIDWMVYGTKTPTQSNNSTRYVSYSDQYNRSSGMQSVPNSAYKPNTINFKNFVFNDRGEAETVLLQLKDIINKYGMACVGDYYDLIGHNGDFTSQKYGWRSLEGVEISRSVDGFMIDFPKIIVLN